MVQLDVKEDLKLRAVVKQGNTFQLAMLLLERVKPRSYVGNWAVKLMVQGDRQLLLCENASPSSLQTFS